jgi:hypothetical protein
MLAFSLLTVGVASAATKPEFKPVPTKKKFTGSTSLTLYAGGESLKCAKGSTSGEVTGARTVGDVVMVFTGCVGEERDGDECSAVKSEGAREGEIVTHALSGELGTVATKEAASGVGLMLKHEGTSKAWFTLEGCVIDAVVTGSTVSEVAVVGKKQTTGEFIDEGKIKQITLDSGESWTSELGDGGLAFEPHNTQELTFEEALEVT